MQIVVTDYDCYLVNIVFFPVKSFILFNLNNLKHITFLNDSQPYELFGFLTALNKPFTFSEQEISIFRRGQA